MTPIEKVLRKILICHTVTSTSLWADINKARRAEHDLVGLLFASYTERPVLAGIKKH